MSGLCYRFQVPGDDYSRAGEASSTVKNRLKRLGVSPEAIRRVSIALYEGEINMVIHGGGGEVTVTVSPDRVDMVLEDHGKGIPILKKPCRRDIPLPQKKPGAWASEPAWDFPI